MVYFETELQKILLLKCYGIVLCPTSGKKLEVAFPIAHSTFHKQNLTPIEQSSTMCHGVTKLVFYALYRIDRFIYH